MNGKSVLRESRKLRGLFSLCPFFGKLADPEKEGGGGGKVARRLFGEE